MFVEQVILCWEPSSARINSENKSKTIYKMFMMHRKVLWQERSFRITLSIIIHYNKASAPESIQTALFHRELCTIDGCGPMWPLCIQWISHKICKRNENNISNDSKNELLIEIIKNMKNHLPDAHTTTIMLVRMSWITCD